MTQSENKSLAKIANEVCIALAINLCDLVGPRRKGCLPDARAIFAHMATEAGWRKYMISKFLHRNHSTIIASLRRYEVYKKEDPLFQARINLVERYLKDNNAVQP